MSKKKKKWNEIFPLTQLNFTVIAISSPLSFLLSLKNKQEWSKEKFEWENNKKMNTTFICQNVKTFSITRHYLIESPIWYLSHALSHNKCPSSVQYVAGHLISMNIYCCYLKQISKWKFYKIANYMHFSKDL